MKHRFWSEYTARDFAQLDHENLIAVLPVGAVEQHGPHLPLSVDQTIVDAIVAATVKQLPEDLPVLILPTMPIGKSNEHSEWPGTLTFSAQTLMAMWTEIGDCVAASGVRKMIFLNSHGGQIAPMEIVVRDLRVKHKMLTVAASWFGLGMPDGVFSDTENRFGIHAGDMETSVMLALQPESVQMDYAQDFHSTIADISRENTHLGLSIAGKIGWQAQDMNPAGACGNAAAASAEKGAKVMAHAAEQVVKLFAEVHRMPLSFLDNTVDQDC